MTDDLPRALLEIIHGDPKEVFKRSMLQRLASASLDDDGGVWFECSRILKEKKMFRDVDKRVQALVREMREIPSIGNGAPRSEKSISEIWPGAPVDESVYAPEGYSLYDSVPAIERIEKRMMGETQSEKRTPVCLAPVLITKRIRHMQTKGIMFEISFRNPAAGWMKCIAERNVFLDSRKIVETAHMGMPVASDNSLELVSWIRHYENANHDRIPIGHASSTMGWQGSDDNPTKHGFMCGTKQIGANGLAIELEGSDGDMMDAKEIRAHGRMSIWMETVRRLAHFPAMRIGILAALASPLLAILEAPIPIYEWAGRTSTGKSTVLKVAQSVWRSGQSQMATWNTTAIGIEAAAQFNCDLPLVVDDTSAAVDGGRSQNIGKVIYQLVSGRARGRGTIKGKQAIRSRWRTVVLATGETPLGELAKQEGASARVLTFWSAPLGDTTTEKASLITDCMHALGENYGHAGPAVVKWLMENKDRWDDLRKLYQEATKQSRSMICTPAASRLADIVALLEVSAYVGKAAGVLPWESRSIFHEPDVVEALRKAMTLASSSSDRAYDAWEYAIGDAQSRPRSWIGWGTKPTSEDRDPPGGWLGYYNADEYAFFPQQLRKLLVAGGFTPEAAFRAWKDLGVLIEPEKDRFTSQCRPKGNREKIRLIRVKNEYPGHEMDDGDDDD